LAEYYLGELSLAALDPSKVHDKPEWIGISTFRPWLATAHTSTLKRLQRLLAAWSRRDTRGCRFAGLECGGDASVGEA
jgi:hypothetical protein